MPGSKRSPEEAEGSSSECDAVDVSAYLNADYSSASEHRARPSEHRADWHARRLRKKCADKGNQAFLATCSAAVSAIAHIMDAYERHRGGFHEMRTYGSYNVTFSVDDYDDKLFRSYFRFEKWEVREIIDALRLPEVIRSPERDSAPAFEVFCMLCLKFGHPSGLFSFIKIFGRSCPVISRLISSLRQLLYDRCVERFKNPPPLSADQCSEFARRIEVICGMPMVVGFIDGTVRPICKPSTLQGPLYNGKDRVHSLKYQAINTPDGIIRHMAGPYPGSRHDMFALHQSEVLQNWILKFPRTADDVPHVIYADAGYSSVPGIETPYADGDFDFQHEAYNQAMAAARISVEWEFGAILQNWAALDFKRQQQLLGNRKVGQMYIVAALLTNFINCLRPNMTSQYFKCKPPSLRDYIASLE